MPSKAMQRNPTVLTLEVLKGGSSFARMQSQPLTRME